MRAIGGNRGYVGYSMSKRALRARCEGRFPKSDFKKEYGLNEKVFKALVEINIIEKSEWHHTSMYGNRTDFYSWCEAEYYEKWIEHADAINELVRQFRKKVSMYDYPATFKGMKEWEKDAAEISTHNDVVYEKIMCFFN